MRPATEVLPKPLLPVAGEPFVVHQLRWLVAGGVTDVVYSIGHLGHLIREELAGRADLGCSLRFVDEGTSLLGTGGAVRLAVDEQAELLDGPFLVLYGDSYLDVDLAAVGRADRSSGAEALMTVFRNDDRWERSNVAFDGTTVRYDKHAPDPAAAGMRYVDYGLSVLHADSVRARIPAGTVCDLADALHVMSTEGRLAGFEVHHRFYEIGTPAGLADLERHLGRGTA